MKLLIYSCHFADPIGIGKFSFETAQWLASRGHEVRVISAPPYYPAWRLASRSWTVRYRLSRRDGFMTLRCPIWVPKQPSGAWRVLHYAIFSLTSFPPLLVWCLIWRPKVVWAVMPPLLTLPSAWFGAGIGNARAWLHIQDLEVDAAFELGLLKNKSLQCFALAIERFLISHFAIVSTISPGMMRKLSEKKLPTSPRLFPNWVDTDAIFPTSSNEVAQYRQTLGAGASFIALYSGNLGRKQGIEMLIETAEQLIELPDVRIVICGDGVSRDIVASAAERLPNLSLFPVQPLSKLNVLLNAADVHLLPQRDEISDLVMPSKLGGMLASGRPVIAAANQMSQLAREISDCGVLVPPGNAEAMARAIRMLRDSPEQRWRMSAQARQRAISHWSKVKILETFENELVNVE